VVSCPEPSRVNPTRGCGGDDLYQLISDLQDAALRGDARDPVELIEGEIALLSIPTAGAIPSIVETCRRLRIPVRDYLAAILPGLADLPMSQVAELTPTAWTARS
jgi:hypothetical protein